jgi:osmotically-inducible protein OsmY
VGLSACTSGSSSPSEATAVDTASTATDTTAAGPASPEPPPEAPSEAEADARSVNQKLTDTSTEARVKQALVQTERLRVFSFRPTVVNGHLVLRGDVNTADQYREAERVAGRWRASTPCPTSSLWAGAR